MPIIRMKGMKNFLTKDEIMDLKLEHKEHKDNYADRIKVILALNEGFTYQEVAKILLLDDSTIRRYEQEYKKGGKDKLLKNNHKGYKGRLTEEEKDELKEHLKQHLMKTSYEVIKVIKEKFGITYSQKGCIELLYRLGFVYKKIKQVPAKANIEKQKAFIEKYKELKKNLTNKDKIYFLDATHLIHNSMPCNGWIYKGEEKKIKSNSGRLRININGALDIREKQIYVLEQERINSKSTIELFRKIEDKNQKARKIYVIADNARYHHSKEIKEYLSNSKIELIFLPPYSPNLNLIERIWKFLKTTVVKGKYYEKFSEFKENVMEFFTRINGYKPQLVTLLSESFQLIDDG